MQGVSATVLEISPAISVELRYRLGMADDATDYSDYEAILMAIGSGLAVARSHPLPDEGDRYAAWCILQELRRAGWVIAAKSS